VLEWALPLGTLAVLLLVCVVLRKTLLERWRRHAQKTLTRWDDVLVDVIASVRVTLIAPSLIYAATRVLSLPGWFDRGLHLLSVACLGVQALVTLRVLVDAGLAELVRRSQRPGDFNAGLSSSVSVIRVLLIGLAAALVVLAALDNMGVSVTPMITGLGIGGVAVALAVQSILSDLFGSFTIILDKPFVVGDYIVVGKQEGTVEQIGIKTTRVRAVSGEQLVFSNTDLLTSRVQNFKRMHQRRVLFLFSVAGATPVEKLRLVPGTVEGLFRDPNKARFDRCHLVWLSDAALAFECVYTMLTPDTKEYMDFHQALNIGLIEGLRRDQIALGPRPPQPV
jgi:small-conductance mechanosensitive channel